MFTSADGGSDGTFAFSFSDLAFAQSTPATNISTRGRVTESHPLIVGFVVPGDASATAPNIFVPPAGVQQREVLVRVVGPSLAPLGLTGTWVDPDFLLDRGNTPAAVAEAHYADGGVPPDSLASAPPDAAAEAAFSKIFNPPSLACFP